MKKQALALLFAIYCAAAAAQVTVEECWQKARENYPLTARAGLIDRARDYTLSNASRGYLPRIQITARATYQSDVTSLPLNIPGMDIPELPKDNYDARAEISQVVWDGGRIRAGKMAAETESGVERQALEVDLYALRERVDQLFFGILLLDAQLEQNKLLHDDLARSREQVKAWIASGVASRADLDAVEAEAVASRQNRASLSSARHAYASMLGAMTGIAGEIIPVPPAADAPGDLNIRRPELALLEARDQQLRSKLKTISANNMPSLGAFAQGGYGRPGLNMLNTSFEPYWLVGARLTWDIGNLYTRRNDRRLVDNARQNVDVQRSTFLFNTRLTLDRQERRVEEIRQLLADDDRLVELRSSLSRAARARAAEGTISVTELMRQVMAEDLARQARNLHQVQLMMAIYDIKVTTNGF